jgi:hypothetical protein
MEGWVSWAAPQVWNLLEVPKKARCLRFCREPCFLHGNMSYYSGRQAPAARQRCRRWRISGFDFLLRSNQSDNQSVPS